MLFDLPHILYMVISAIITGAIMVAAAFLLKSQRSKDSFLKFWAVITVVIHFSSIYTDYYIDKVTNPELSLSMFIPAFACNVCMWLLVIVAFANKENKFIKLLCQFVALGGIVCGIVGILINENYGAFGAANPGVSPMTDYEIVKGLLSHSTMLAGSIYLLVGKYVKPRALDSTIGVAIGLSILLVDGILVNTLNRIFDMPDVNSMYLHGAPFENMPWVNTLTIGIVGVLVAFLIGVIVEFITLPKEERWYSRLKKKSTEFEEEEKEKITK